jgi:uncharacterized tellurite resistance protein B-like protein
MQSLDGELGQLYAQALLAIARVDREIGPEEASRVRELVAKRSPVEIDVEASFFHKVTPEELAAAASAIDRRELGRALVADGVSLATADGDLNSMEGHAILRFAHALGCTVEDIGAITHELDEWLH